MVEISLKAGQPSVFNLNSWTVIMMKLMNMIIILFCFLGLVCPSKAASLDRERMKKKKSQSYQSVPDSRFREIFSNYLYKRLKKTRSDVIVSRFKIVGNKPVPIGKLGFRVFQKEKRPLEGYVRVIAIVSVNGVARNKVQLMGWIDIFDSVVCAARNLKKKEIIKKEDVYLARRNISHLAQEVIHNINKVVGLRAKHSIRAETCIKTWMLEKTPVVERGDLVTILAESGDLKVTVPGKILERGYLGDLIRVENAMSKKKIYAKVINHSIVLVNF